MDNPELRSLLANRDDILTDPRGSNPEVFRSVGKGISNLIQTIRSRLRDISATVWQIGSNHKQFRITRKSCLCEIVSLHNRDQDLMALTNS
jgi:hypothetical protein